MRQHSYKTVYLYLTNECNTNCSFCYRKNREIESCKSVMTKDMAFKTLDYIFTNLKIKDNLNIAFWGGEPFMNFDVIKAVINKYPQFHYMTNTNGELFNDEICEFVKNHKNFTVNWSCGNAYEKFGSYENKIKACSKTTEVIRDNRHNIVMTVTSNYDKVYEDFMFLYNINPGVGVTLANRHHHSDEQLREFEKQYLKITNLRNEPPIIISNSNLWKEYIGEPIIPDYCRHSLERIFVDTEGGLWGCDGAYMNQHNKLGDIYKGIDYSKTELFWEIEENRTKYLSKYCEECEIHPFCVENKCLYLNYEYNKDYFKPENEFCKIQKTWHRIIKTYINNRSKV